MRIIFIHPKPMEEATSGGRLRSAKMLETFSNLGYHVEAVTGNREERISKYHRLKDIIESGERFDYVYVESLSRPTNSRIDSFFGLKYMSRENLDFDFLRYCRKNDIEVVFFLRDLFWDFDDHYSTESWLKAKYLKWSLSGHGKAEMKFLKTEGIQVFCPTQRFADHLLKNWGVNAVPLPPGSEIHDSKSRSLDNEHLELFYVGGVAGKYDPQEFIRGVSNTSTCQLTVCTRPSEIFVLNEFSDEENLSIVTGFGEQLSPYYSKAHIGIYPLPPFGYVTLAHSVKISEYISYGLPIIAFERTHVSEYINEHGIGWTIPYSSKAVTDLLNTIVKNPRDYRAKQENVLKFQSQIEWPMVIKRLEQELLK